MVHRQLNLSDNLPLSVVPEQEIKCVYCGSNDYSFKENITRKDGTKAQAFRCKKCHKEFRDNYKFKNKFSNRNITGEYTKEHKVCPHCQSKNYKKEELLLEKMELPPKDLNVKLVIKLFLKITKSTLLNSP